MGILSNGAILIGLVLFQILITSPFFGTCFQQNILPANFVFGDSLVDVGNNNYILTLSQANHFPNGIDFGEPTGRYTNGRTAIDIIGQALGLKNFTPPYLAPTTTGPVILQGVNYGSGGAGIFNTTGYMFGGRVNMDAQIDNFANTRRDIISNIGYPAAMQLLRKAIFSITMGSNDFINNYFIPFVTIAKQNLLPPEIFVATMISRFRLQLIRLYYLGARKIIVVNVGPIGCIPYVRDTNPNAGEDCVELPNQLAQLFNTKLRSLVVELSNTLVESNLVYADTYYIVQDIINNYKSYGFEIANTSCCNLAGRFGGLVPCGPLSEICERRSKYVFWDSYHPSEAANLILARRLLDGDSNDISPINIRQLANL
ncbi:hypothetical protein UlMin_009701 [Ulmus minor]